MSKRGHSSASHPDLPNKPGKTNWIEKAGGLPPYISRIAKHLVADQGFTVSHAIAAAVNTVKRWAKGGGDVTPATRAKAQKALAQWNAKRGKARADRGLSTRPAGWTPEKQAREIHAEKKKKWDEAAHPRADSGSPAGGQFIAAGEARDDRGKKAQENKAAEKNFKSVQESNEPRKMIAAMKDADLEALTEYLYSFKSMDKKIVERRLMVAAELKRRGKDVNDFGGRGKGRPAGRGSEKKASKPVELARTSKRDILVFELASRDFQPRYPKGHPKGGQWMDIAPGDGRGAKADLMTAGGASSTEIMSAVYGAKTPTSKISTPSSFSPKSPIKKNSVEYWERARDLTIQARDKHKPGSKTWMKMEERRKDQQAIIDVMNDTGKKSISQDEWDTLKPALKTQPKTFATVDDDEIKLDGPGLPPAQPTTASVKPDSMLFASPVKNDTPAGLDTPMVFENEDTRVFGLEAMETSAASFAAFDGTPEGNSLGGTLIPNVHEIEDHYRRSGVNMPSAAVDIAREYTGHSFTEFNQPLRGGSPMTPGVKDKIEKMDEAAAAYALPVPTVLTRATNNYKLPKENLVGKPLRDNAFMSTSVGFGSAFGGTGDGTATLHIFAPAGTRGISVDGAFEDGGLNPGEREFILPRGTTLMISRDEVDQWGGRHITGTVIPVPAVSAPQGIDRRTPDALGINPAGYSSAGIEYLRRQGRAKWAARYAKGQTLALARGAWYNRLVRERHRRVLIGSAS